ncbi:MAG: LuxR C-terminal-related transcriptional regulator [Pseudomonadota bacterium]
MTRADAALKPARAVEALLGRGFPGHTMQRIRLPDGRYRYGYVGAGVKDLFGLDPEDLMRREAVDHAWVHPDDRGRFIAALDASARDLTPLDEEVRVARPSGGFIWVRSIGHPRRQADGTVIWDGVALDVDDRHQALDAIGQILASMRETEAAEGRFSAIAAQDIDDRLADLRVLLTRLGGHENVAGLADFAAVQAAVDALAAAILANTNLVTHPADTQPTASAGLTSRQAEILRLVAEGTPNRGIAAALHISEGTVKQHLSAIFKRLGVTNRTEAARALGHNARPAGDATA